MPLDSLATETDRHESLEVQYHVRGRRKRQPLSGRCHTVKDVIDLGQQSFPAFTDRNPWICIDSKRGTVFVGLDPEPQVSAGRRAGNLRRNHPPTEESILR